jgi:hypothetical protein
VSACGRAARGYRVRNPNCGAWRAPTGRRQASRHARGWHAAANGVTRAVRALQQTSKGRGERNFGEHARARWPKERRSDQEHHELRAHPGGRRHPEWTGADGVITWRERRKLWRKSRHWRWQDGEQRWRRDKRGQDRSESTEAIEKANLEAVIQRANTVRSREVRRCAARRGRHDAIHRAAIEIALTARCHGEGQCHQSEGADHAAHNATPERTDQAAHGAMPGCQRLAQVRPAHSPQLVGEGQGVSRQ